MLVRPRIDDKAWRAFQLVKIDNRPLDEVAQELGKSVMAVGRFVHRVSKAFVGANDSQKMELASKLSVPFDQPSGPAFTQNCSGREELS